MMSATKTVSELFKNYDPSIRVRVDKLTNPDDPTDGVDIFEDLILIEDIGAMYKVHTSTQTFFAPAAHEMTVENRKE